MLTSSTGKARKDAACRSSDIGGLGVPSTDLDLPSPIYSSEVRRCTCNDADGPAEIIPISGPVWVKNKAQESGEYPYAARLLPSRAVVAAGSGFQEVRVVGRDTLLVR